MRIHHRVIPLAAGLSLALSVLLSTAPSPAFAGGGMHSANGRLAQGSIAASKGTAKGGRQVSGSGNRVNTANNANVGNNVNIGNDVDIDIDGGYNHHGWDDHHYHPVAAGIVVGAVAATTAATLGAYYYSLPAGCTTVYKNGQSYWVCGSVYYNRTWYGNDVVYVVVSP